MHHYTNTIQYVLRHIDLYFASEKCISPFAKRTKLMMKKRRREKKKKNNNKFCQ